ncbi:hypothetical protein Q5P01_020950 [Channa striata]|uniref:Uncharacterized protein n=1 Tax=Channa striata TaxID=64152 RepID=A0AA88SBY5_CHASR|nr:hypothetical protein Q5P01_020950 [Channa striata]
MSAVALTYLPRRGGLRPPLHFSFTVSAVASGERAAQMPECHYQCRAGVVQSDLRCPDNEGSKLTKRRRHNNRHATIKTTKMKQKEKKRPTLEGGRLSFLWPGQEGGDANVGSDTGGGCQGLKMSILCAQTARCLVVFNRSGMRGTVPNSLTGIFLCPLLQKAPLLLHPAERERDRDGERQHRRPVGAVRRLGRALASPRLTSSCAANPLIPFRLELPFYFESPARRSSCVRCLSVSTAAPRSSYFTAIRRRRDTSRTCRGAGFCASPPASQDTGPAARRDERTRQVWTLRTAARQRRTGF